MVRAAPRGPLLGAAPSLAALLPECLGACAHAGPPAASLLAAALGCTVELLCADAGREAAAPHAGALLDALAALAAPPPGAPRPPPRVRHTAAQGLLAAAGLPYARIFPHRRAVLRALGAAADDPRRAVRMQAVAARTVWAALPDA